MCLKSKWRFPRRAKKDIVCYKWLNEGPKPNSIIYSTPFTGFSVALNSTIIPDEYCTLTLFKGYEKGEGYIHAFTDKKSAALLRFVGDYLFETIIPKGTKYHISKDGESICAKKMYITDHKIC